MPGHGEREATTTKTPRLLFTGFYLIKSRVFNPLHSAARLLLPPLPSSPLLSFPTATELVVIAVAVVVAGGGV